MKMRKLSFLKRIFVFFCCTLLLSSSIFASYSMTVYAADDDFNFGIAVVDVILIIAGLIEVSASGGTLTPVAAAQVTLALTSGGKEIYDYLSDNGDGTYTIDQSFIQAVMDAAEKLEEQGFSDSNITEQWSRNGYSLKCFAVKKEYIDGLGRLHHIAYEYSSDKFIPCCVIRDDSATGLYLLTYYENGLYKKAISGRWKDSFEGQTGLSVNFPGVSECESFSANVPIFVDSEIAKNYLLTGKGYKDAENYRAQPLFRRHSSYTPVYSGGSITVSRTVIENITQKITEVDADDSMTDDQKIEKLQEYIRSGGTSDTGGDGGTGGGSGDTDYEDNKDQPPGTDLADSNSWLKKIYLKVCQIYDRINSAVEDVEQTALAKIQESLDEIIVQLKKIKHWTAVDTVVDGVDAIADWLDLIHDVISDADEGAESAVSSISSALDDAAGVMIKKFPFSIPWDLFFLISFFSAEPEVPHFEIPFRIPYFNFEYTFVIDFGDYQWLSDVIRPILLMSYAIGLLSKTPSILSVGKEE